MVIDTGRNAVEFSQGQRFDSFCFDLPQKIIRKNFPKTIDKSAQVCYNNYSKRKEIKKMKTFAIKITGCVYIKANTPEIAAEKLFQGLKCLPPEIYDFDYATGIDGWEEIKEEDL